LPERNGTQRLLPSRTGLECDAGFSPSLSRSLHGIFSPAPLAVAIFYYGEEASGGSDNASSRRLGAWLSRGLDATVIVIVLAWSAAFLLPVLSEVLHERGIVDFKYLNHPAAQILQWLGLATGHLPSWLLWPDRALPFWDRAGRRQLSANITERENSSRTHSGALCSLLRYLADGRDKDRSYDRIVIMAHSLGALISGDLLLYLRSQGDPQLGRIGFGDSKVKGEVELRLFTMGDPVRQFLNRFFPYLYEWVRETPITRCKTSGPLSRPRRANLSRACRTQNGLVWNAG